MDTAIITSIVKKALKKPRFAVLCNELGSFTRNGAQFVNCIVEGDNSGLNFTAIVLKSSRMTFAFSLDHKFVWVADHEGDEKMVEWLEAY